MARTRKKSTSSAAPAPAAFDEPSSAAIDFVFWLLANWLYYLQLLAVALPLALLNGFVLSWLWYWFVAVPGLVRSLSSAEACGLWLVLQFVLCAPHQGDGPSWKDAISKALLFLAVGYVLRLAMINV